MGNSGAQVGFRKMMGSGGRGALHQEDAGALGVLHWWQSKIFDKN